MPEWIKHTGNYAVVNNICSLKTEYRRLSIRFRESDYKIVNEDLYLKKGSLPVTFIKPSNWKGKGIGKEKCDGEPTMCIDGTEFCCDNGRAIDNCNGHWVC